MKTKIYGSSDDLVQIEGAVCEEHGDYSQAKKGIPFFVSDGTEGSITYNGKWTIDLTKKGKKVMEIIKSVGNDERHQGEAEDCSPYSDVLVLKNGIEWVKVGNETYTK